MPKDHFPRTYLLLRCGHYPYDYDSYPNNTSFPLMQDTFPLMNLPRYEGPNIPDNSELKQLTINTFKEKILIRRGICEQKHLKSSQECQGAPQWSWEAIGEVGLMLIRTQTDYELLDCANRKQLQPIAVLRMLILLNSSLATNLVIFPIMTNINYLRVRQS